MARAKTHKTWTTDEETTLTVLVDRGITPLEIAKILGRTETSIIDKRQIQKDESQARYGKPWTSEEDSDLTSGMNNEAMQVKWQRGLKELSKRRFLLKQQKQEQQDYQNKRDRMNTLRDWLRNAIIDLAINKMYLSAELHDVHISAHAFDPAFKSACAFYGVVVPMFAGKYRPDDIDIHNRLVSDSRFKPYDQRDMTFYTKK